MTVDNTYKSRYKMKEMKKNIKVPQKLRRKSNPVSLKAQESDQQRSWSQLETAE